MNVIMKPFALLLRFLNSTTGNYAIALLFFALAVKVLLLYFNVKQQKSAQGQARIRPQLLAIRKRYEGRRDQYVQSEYQKDMMELYQREKVSPTSGCLPLLIQLPFIMILYQIIINPLTYIAMASAEAIGSVKTIIFNSYATLNAIPDKLLGTINEAVAAGKTAADISITEIQMINIMKANEGAFTEFTSQYSIPNFSVGALDLSAVSGWTIAPLLCIPVLVFAFQLIQSLVVKLFSANDPAQQAQNGFLMVVLPAAISAYFAATMPAMLGLYWIYQSIFATVIHVIISKLLPIPSYTPEQVEAIIALYNKDYVRPEIEDRRSLYSIDDEADEEEDIEDGEEVSTSKYADEDLPERRRFDKNGNRIRSLHFIDEDEEVTENEKEQSDENN